MRTNGHADSSIEASLERGAEGQSKMGGGPGQAEMRGLDLQVFRVHGLADQVDGLTEDG